MLPEDKTGRSVQKCINQTKNIIKCQMSIENSEAYLEPCQTSKTDIFAKIINGFQSLTIFAKSSITDIWQGYENVSEISLNAVKVSFA